jgi:hypothetical protein
MTSVTTSRNTYFIGFFAYRGAEMVQKSPSCPLRQILLLVLAREALCQRKADLAVGTVMTLLRMIAEKL